VITVLAWSAGYMYSAFAVAGGLLSYGPRENDPSFSWHRPAYFVDKILRGGQPSELPVEQPTRFYLTVNLKSADYLASQCRRQQSKRGQFSP
jgi:putative tryptophan/tyrosine transport system substrate-binding protein